MQLDIRLWEELKKGEASLREKERKKTLAETKGLLKKYFGDKRVNRVFLFGSILKKGDFYPFSDIDVVVDGLSERYFKTLCDLEEILGREVDLVEFESSRLKEAISKRGMKII